MTPSWRHLFGPDPSPKPATRGRLAAMARQIIRASDEPWECNEAMPFSPSWELMERARMLGPECRETLTAMIEALAAGDEDGKGDRRD